MGTLFLEPRLRKNIDRYLLLAVALLMAASLLAIHAATWNTRAGAGPALRQGVYFAVGLVLMGLVAARDYANVPRIAGFLYWGNLAVLALVLLFAPDVKGAARWIHLPIPGMDVKLQPSEFAKVSVILTLSGYVAGFGARIRELPVLLKTLGHVLVPMVLIMKQPDLGTSLVLLAIWTGIVFLAGARWQHLLGLLLVAVVLFTAAWKVDLIKGYQKDRVRTFANPMSDPLGKGYHVLQSEIAIGGGQVTGQGLYRGMQTNNHFIPENHTDFIFTVVGEETGFVGASLLLGVYALLLFRGLVTIAECEDPIGRLIAGGVVTLFAFHLMVNMGMTCGIMPVVGVPLPLMSFGGSSAWANLIAVGLLLGIHMRRHKILF
jgi:rod shape determining protein RodA